VLPSHRLTGSPLCLAAPDPIAPAPLARTDDLQIHYIAPNIYCCGAGTSADTENTTAMISSKLALLRLATGSASRVVTAMTMLKRYLFRYQGYVSAALVLGGVDVTGAHLYTVYPHGSTDKLPFVSMGSGSLAAMSVLESGFKDDMTEDECVRLVADAVRAGIFNDLGSGSNVDITVLRTPPAPGAAAGVPAGAAAKPLVTIMRGFDKPNDVTPLRQRIDRPATRIVPVGAAVVLKKTFVPAAAARPTAAAPGVAMVE